MKNLKNFKNNNRENRKKTIFRKENFYPNHFDKDLIPDCLRDFGAIAKQAVPKKSHMQKVRKSIQRLRFIAQLPYCSKHYFGIERIPYKNIL